MNKTVITRTNAMIRYMTQTLKIFMTIIYYMNNGDISYTNTLLIE